MELDHEALQSRIAAGDEAAFGKLYGHFYQRLYKFSLSLVRVEDMAKEVVTDVFVKIWLNRSHLPAIQNVAVYLYVAVKNQSLNKLSAQAREWINAPLEELLVEPAALEMDPFSQMISAEMIAQVNQAIAALPPRCQLIFKLVREDGLRYKEVAEILNISVNTIDVQMATAIKKICQSMALPKKMPISFQKK